MPRSLYQRHQRPWNSRTGAALVRARSGPDGSASAPAAHGATIGPWRQSGTVTATACLFAAGDIARICDASLVILLPCLAYGRRPPAARRRSALFLPARPLPPGPRAAPPRISACRGRIDGAADSLHTDRTALIGGPVLRPSILRAGPLPPFRKRGACATTLPAPGDLGGFRGMVCMDSGLSCGNPPARRRFTPVCLAFGRSDPLRCGASPGHTPS